MTQERPTPEEQEELKKLRFNPRVLAYLQRCRDKSQHHLVGCPDVSELRVTQGVAQTYMHLLRLIEED